MLASAICLELRPLPCTLKYKLYGLLEQLNHTEHIVTQTAAETSVTPRFSLDTTTINIKSSHQSCASYAAGTLPHLGVKARAFKAEAGRDRVLLELDLARPGKGDDIRLKIYTRLLIERITNWARDRVKLTTVGLGSASRLGRGLKHAKLGNPGTGLFCILKLDSHLSDLHLSDFYLYAQI